MFHTALFADGLRDSELEKSALKMVTDSVDQFQSGTSKLLFVQRLTEADPHIVAIREIIM